MKGQKDLLHDYINSLLALEAEKVDRAYMSGGEKGQDLIMWIIKTEKQLFKHIKIVLNNENITGTFNTLFNEGEKEPFAVEAKFYIPLRVLNDNVKETIKVEITIWCYSGIFDLYKKRYRPDIVSNHIVKKALEVLGSIELSNLEGAAGGTLEYGAKV